MRSDNCSVNSNSGLVASGYVEFDLHDLDLWSDDQFSDLKMEVN